MPRKHVMPSILTKVPGATGSTEFENDKSARFPVNVGASRVPADSTEDTMFYYISTHVRI